MITLLVDANIVGQGRLIEMRLATPEWRDFREQLGIRFLSFEDVNFSPDTKDDVLWRFCQEHGCYLLTANRNLQDETSLEATIRREGTSNSLPVLTLADEERISQSPVYLEKVVEALLDRLLFQENLRGTGRVFLP